MNFLAPKGGKFMSLKQYFERTVAIVTDNGKMFFGVIDDYIYPDDNEHNLESIVLKTANGDLYEFTNEDIETIKII